MLILRGRRVGRRRFLAASAAGVFAGGGAVFKLSRGIQPRQVAAAVIEPLTGTPLAFLSDASLPQGNAFSIHVSTFDADSATAIFNGQQIALLPDAADTYLVGL